MSKKIVMAIAVAAVAVGSLAGSAEAQRPFRIGVAGGVSVPVSDLGDEANTGFVLRANISIKPIGLPFTLQAEGGWNEWGIKDADGNIRSLSLTANVLYDFPTYTPLKPYILGLGGLYHLTSSTDVGPGTFSSSSNKFGLGAGVGLRMPLGGLDTYFEARYTHVLDSSVSFVPITFGVRF